MRKSKTERYIKNERVRERDKAGAVVHQMCTICMINESEIRKRM
jgi:hypothetical protein